MSNEFKGCHEIKRCLLLGRKFMTNLDSILLMRLLTTVYDEFWRVGYPAPRTRSNPGQMPLNVY